MKGYISRLVYLLDRARRQGDLVAVINLEARLRYALAS